MIPKPVATVSLDSDRNPILYLDVNLGNNEMARIIVYEGDNPSDVTD